MAGDVVTASGTKVYIYTGALSPTVDTLSEYAALTPWQEIGLIESVGEFGDESSAVTFAAVGDGRTRKSKGARDAGTLALTVAHDPLDAGQAALEVAEGTNNNYAFKVVLPDGPAGYTDTTIYFKGLVMSKRLNVGSNDNILKRTFNVAVNSELFTDLASTT